MCQQCGEALQTWYAIFLPHQNLQTPVAIGPVLGDNQRYRLTDVGATLLPSNPLAAQVVDCHPNAASPLKDLQAQWLENPDLDHQKSHLAEQLPIQAFPYLALQVDHFPAVPEIHHAYNTDSYAALLIEDRTHWTPLKQRWHQGPDSVLKQIQWLFEIVLLWEALVPWRQEETLLQMNQFVTNTHDVLCLSQLNSGSPPKTVTLKHLGFCWQKFLRMVEKPPFKSGLVQVADALAQGEITTTHALKETLANLAEQRVTPAATPISKVPDFVARDGAMKSAPHPPSPESPSPKKPELGQELPPALVGDQLTLTAADLSQTANPQPDPTLSPVPNDSQFEPPEMPTMVLPMKLAQLDEAGQTHVGIQRNHNEDCFFAYTNSVKEDSPNGFTLNSKGLYIVCDGMGGHASGEIASQLAVKTIKEFFAQHWHQDLPDQSTLAKAVLTANQAIYDLNQANASSGLGRMGTTLVMLLIQDLRAAVVHVGDSRLYSYCKRRELQQLTLDHEVGQREINRGIEPATAYARPDAYQLTQALGPRHRSEVKPTINYYDITQDTLFLLCSDGLSDNSLLERYADSHIAPLLSAKKNLENGLAALIDLANEKNGHDNITAIMTRLKLRPDMQNLPR